MVKGGEGGLLFFCSHQPGGQRSGGLSGRWQTASSGSLLDWPKEGDSWLVYCMLGLGMASMTRSWLQWAALDRS